MPCRLKSGDVGEFIDDKVVFPILLSGIGGRSREPVSVQDAAARPSINGHLSSIFL
jgi:hypothetical protein